MRANKHQYTTMIGKMAIITIITIGIAPEENPAERIDKETN